MLGHLRSRRAPEATVKELEKSKVAHSVGLRWRQLALIDMDGRGAYFTEAKITSIAKGPGRPRLRGRGQHAAPSQVVDAMVEPLAERLLPAIEAGRAAGGELKQLKSARPAGGAQGELSGHQPARRPQHAAARGAAFPVGALSADGERL